jgi:hypothetical protein
VLPGRYKVTLSRRVAGVETPLAGPEEFAVVVEGAAGMDLAERKTLFEFQQKVARLQRAVAGALDAANELTGRLDQARRAIDQTPTVPGKWKEVVRDLEKRNRAILRALRSDVALRARNENTPPSIVERVNDIVDAERFSLAAPTQTQRDAYKIAGQEFSQELARLRTLITVDLPELEKALNVAGAPFTTGRLLEWKEK